MEWTLLIYFSLLLFLSRLNIRLAVLLLVFILPAYLIRFTIFTIPTTVLEMSIVVVFLSWFFDNRKKLFKIKKDQDREPYPFGWEIIFIVIIAFASVFVGGISNTALGIFKAYFLVPVILFILILNTIRGDKGVRQIIVALAGSTLLVSLFAIWQNFSGQFISNEFWANPENRRVVSFFGYPNALALYVAPVIPLILGLFALKLKERSSLLNFFSQLSLFLIVVINISAIYFSKSKGALMALAVSLIVAMFVLFKKKMKIIFLAALIIIGSSLYYFQKDYIALKASSSLSFEIRKAQWLETWEMLQDDNFLWGSGLGNYQSKIEPYHQDGIFFNKFADPDFRRKIVIFDDKYRQEHWQPVEIYLYPHNIFLNFWTELGFLGMIVFSFLIIKFMFVSYRYYLREKVTKNKYLGLALFSSMIIIFVHGLFDVPYFKNDLSALFWILIAILSVLTTHFKSLKLWQK